MSYILAKDLEIEIDAKKLKIEQEILLETTCRLDLKFKMQIRARGKNLPNNSFHFT